MIKEYSDFLEALRKSGKTNMFGAGVYLEDEFGLSKKDARQVLLDWMQSYQKDD
jgi:hypothetical protein